MTTPPPPVPAVRRRRVVVVLALIALAVVTVLLVRSLERPADRADADPRPEDAATPAATAPVAPDDGRDGSAGTGPAPDGGDRGSPQAPPPAASPSAPAAATTLPPVPVGTDVTLQPGLVATVSGVDALTVRPRGPGDLSGRGAAVHLELRNAGKDAVDLAGLSVTATGADGAPAPASDDRTAAPITGSLPAGGSRSGTYVFRLPEGGAPLRVSVGVNTSSTVAVVTSR